MTAQHIDVAVFVPGSNLRYLSGIGFSTKLRLACLIVPLEGTPAIVLPTMEAPRAQAQAQFPLTVYGWDDDAGPAHAVATAFATLGIRGGTIAVEHVVMRVFELRAIEAALPAATIVNADPLIAQLRMHKTADELAAMQRAITVAETSLAQAIAAIRPGMNELQVAELWEKAIRAAGSVPSFDLAVGAGPNGASPHHTNGTRLLQAGDLVVIDGGAIVDGYVSDITRTIAVGTLSPRAKLVYDTVLAANVAGRAAAALPGATGDSVDRAARAVIVAAGFGDAFIHRTGHGLGIDIHEPPFMVGGDMNQINPGMTFTVEPGIYLPGEFGVRIEDMLVRTADGAITMTSFPRELQIILGDA
jgi:Xaa-Pro aminopeptidase